jgi:hypothetical protein
MTGPELEAYASDGILPSWFETTVGATASAGERRRMRANMMIPDRKHPSLPATGINPASFPLG